MCRLLATRFLLATLCLAAPLSTAHAVFTTTGNVSPADPSTWTSYGNGHVGATADGTLTVDSNSDLLSLAGYVGDTTGVTGVVTVDGTGSTWTNSSALYVGWSGNGTLKINNGGAVSNTTGYIGYNANGYRIWSASTGTVTVDGASSKWTNSSDLYVGKSGNGTLKITGGGAVSNTTGYIGYDTTGYDIWLTPTGTVTVDGASSKWTNSSGLYVGKSGNGTLKINNGGAVSSFSGYIGNSPGSMGVVTVDGGSSRWTNETELIIGGSGRGTLNITNGGTVFNRMTSCVIGCDSGSTGVVTVDGAGSTWTSSWGDATALFVGSRGNGTLNITNGGTVKFTAPTYVGYDSGSTGAINFGDGGGTLTTSSLYAAPTQLTGTGTINTSGLVSDVDLVIDSDHGLNQTLTFNQSDKNITVNLDLTSNNGYWGGLGAGYRGNGSLTIRDGMAVYSNGGSIGFHLGSTGVVTVAGTGSRWNAGNIDVGYSGNGTLNIINGGAVSNINSFIGQNSGSTGVVTVSGTGSTWTNSSNLRVGYNGSGTLNITNGGTVSNTSGTICSASGSTGSVTVTGTGSSWTNSSSLSVGYYYDSKHAPGIGTLNIASGGTVAATGVSISNQSLLTVDVSNGSNLAVGGGSGTITNNGLVRILAGANASAGTYTPILATTWSGTGTYQAIGGTWNANHTFTVSPV